MATATVTGLLAMAAVVGGAPDECPGEGAVRVQVRVFTMDGLGWRSGTFGRLQPIATRGTSTVWTADRALLGSLQGWSQASEVLPVSDSDSGETTVSRLKTVNYVDHVARKGPAAEADAADPARFVGKTAQFETGIEARVAGRRIEQGYLADVALADTRLLEMHKVKVSEVVACPASAQPGPKTQTVGTAFQVPEIARTEIEGEWLIPNDGVLVVSLGVHTMADAHGRAVTQERVATIELSPEAPPTPIAVSQLNGGPARVESAEGLTRVDTRFGAIAQADMAPPAPIAPSHLVDTGRQPEPVKNVISKDIPNGRAYADIVVDVDEAPTGLLRSGVTTFRMESLSGTNAPSEGVARTNYEIVSTPAQPAAPAPAASLPTPAAPSRSLPMAVDAEGKPVETSPVPATAPYDDDFRTASHHPSPQAPPIVSTVDPALAQASFTAVAPGVTTASDAAPPAPSVPTTPIAPQAVSAAIHEALRSPGRTETMRIPLFRNFALEIKATVVAGRDTATVVDAKAAPKD